MQDRYDAERGRRLRRAGRVHRPLPDRARRRRRGGRRPDLRTDAIWSHRWYAAIDPAGPNGFPGVNVGEGGTSGDQTIPDNPTGVWVGDYTIQPENGGLGVFAHEFGHDLDLPDLYDTSGNTGGAENSTGFWTLMSSGANLGDGGREGIGDAPPDLGAWEKFQLGWLGCPGCPGGACYDVAQAGTWSKHVLGPNNRATSKGKQALFTLLPDKERVDQLGAPFEGQFMFFSDAGDDLNTTMTKAVGAGSLTAKVRYDTESGYDYWFLETSSDGTEFTPVLTNLSAPASEDQSGFNSSGAGMTGQSAGYSDGSYVDLTATVPAGTTAIRFRYQTDSGLTRPGVLIDNVAVDGGVIGTAETDQEGWTFDGFRRTTGTETSTHFNAYIAEYRNYRGYDQSLATAYNFGFLDSRPNWVEHFPYQDGMLVTYWDDSFSDNNVGDHPGGGLVLPVDAHPTFYHWYDGQLLRARILSFDSTFGRRPTDAITVNKDSQPTRIKSQPAVPVFNDLKDYWFNSDQHAATGDHVGRYQPGWSGVQVPKTGTTIKVKKTYGGGNYMKVVVARSP